jgi:hypothetical protein
MIFIHFENVIVLVLDERPQESLRFEQISTASTSPEANKPGMNAQWKSRKPIFELSFSYPKPEK